jgi:hypothetical protein
MTALHAPPPRTQKQDKRGEKLSLERGGVPHRGKVVSRRGRFDPHRASMEEHRLRLDLVDRRLDRLE